MWFWHVKNVWNKCENYKDNKENTIDQMLCLRSNVCFFGSLTYTIEN